MAPHSCPGIKGVGVVVIAAVVLAAAGITAADQTPNGYLRDLRPEVYNGDALLNTVVHALPAFAIGALSFILVMRFVGVLEMGAFSVLVLLATIGGLVWKFYWPRGY
jgi:hypothetical protein